MESDPAVSSLIEAHVTFALQIARSFQRKLPPFLDFNDLLGQAYLGLVRAARKYRSSTQVPFRAYAAIRIRGEIRELLRRKSRKHSDTAQLSECPEAVNALHASDNTEERIDKERIAAELMLAIESLDARAQEIIALRYWCGYNGTEAGKVLGIEKAWSSELHRKALQSLHNSPHGKRIEAMVMKKPQSVSIDAAKRAAVVDELGAVRDRLAKLKKESKPDMDREKELEEELQSWIPAKLAADEGTTFYGKKYQAVISPRKNERTITDMLKVVEWVGGIVAFIKHCKFPLKAAEVLLTPDQQKEVILQERTGARTIEVEPLDKAEMKKAA